MSDLRFEISQILIDNQISNQQSAISNRQSAISNNNRQLAIVNQFEI